VFSQELDRLRDVSLLVDVECLPPSLELIGVFDVPRRKNIS